MDLREAPNALQCFSDVARLTSDGKRAKQHGLRLIIVPRDARPRLVRLVCAYAYAFTFLLPSSPSLSLSPSPVRYHLLHIPFDFYLRDYDLESIVDLNSFISSSSSSVSSGTTEFFSGS